MAAKSKETWQEQEDRMRKIACETLKAHTYKRLASWGTDNEVWECSVPGSSHYAFTISVTRMGISVVGDLDSVTFNVGSNYGMKFLAGTDISYYIHSKLEAHCREPRRNGLKKADHESWLLERLWIINEAARRIQEIKAGRMESEDTLA